MLSSYAGGLEIERLSDYDYDLPEQLIAQTPLADRAASRLLFLPKVAGEPMHLAFRESLSLLEPRDVLVLNDTRVTARRIQATRVPTGGQIELLLLKEDTEAEFICMAKPARRLKPGDLLALENDLSARVIGVEPGGLKRIRIEAKQDWRELLAKSGVIPLPPYIQAALGDEERYQTVYAKAGGSAAAPTAGLHFTSEILDQLRLKGVQIATVTLDVSLDTFRPIQVEALEDHVMHGETCRISSDSADLINARQGRLIAVGTTSVRTLESFAIHGKVQAGEQKSTLFIRPGYAWKVVEGMFTNFHMPRTTMMAMLAAMVGRERLLGAYAEAVSKQYRFLSFGDSMLIL